MISKINTAVFNNIAWCELISTMHDIAHTTTDHIWGLLSKAPPFYPDIITSSSYATVEEVKKYIENGTVSSIKDSYANLDLSALGFQILFKAEWIYHSSITPTQPNQSCWKVITKEAELEKWASIHGLQNVIKPELLKQTNVRIFSKESSGKNSGFIANLNDNAVGISNVLSDDSENESLWRDIVELISVEFPGFPLVGYEHDNGLRAALLSGWESIGPLQIWLKFNG